MDRNTEVRVARSRNTLVYRIWYRDEAGGKLSYEDTAARNRDDALVCFGRMMGKRKVRVTRMQERARAPGLEDKPKTDVANDDVERGEWWKDGGQPPEGLPL